MSSPSSSNETCLHALLCWRISSALCVHVFFSTAQHSSPTFLVPFSCQMTSNLVKQMMALLSILLQLYLLVPKIFSLSPTYPVPVSSSGGGLAGGSGVSLVNGRGEAKRSLEETLKISFWQDVRFTEESAGKNRANLPTKMEQVPVKRNKDEEPHE